LIFAIALLALLPAAASAQVPAGATWTQAYVDTPDGEQLHIDVLRPAGLPADAKTPVIAVISPYLGHGPQDPTATPQPNGRFNAFFEGAKVFERGWTVILADLRGTGGSSGCLDILGPGEQTDIKTVVEWAADQTWSTGKVAMYGKSYDGNTGVAAAAIRPRGLAAVVAQQVVGDRYSGSYSGGVRYSQSLMYPFASYGTQAELGWTFDDDQQYTVNSASQSADCQAGLAGHYDPSPDTEFWKVRNFVEKGKGSTVPFLMTHGFLDINTNIGAKAIDFFNVLQGPKRLWLGWWDHVRGDDMAGDRLAMGRAGWYDEVMRFLDEHVRGVPSTPRDPAMAIQDSDGRWRAEAAWPPADAREHSAPLKAGSYEDDGRNLGSNDGGAGAGGLGLSDGTTGAGAWTVSPPLEHTAQLAGIPTAAVDAAPVAPDTNLVVNVYDVAPDGKATMISRGARLIDAAGVAELPLYPVEWTLHPGHRVGVLVSGANAEAWVHKPTGTTVEVKGGTIRLPFLTYAREADLPGTAAPRLEEFRETAPFDIPATALEAVEAALVPPAPIPRPATPGGTPAAPDTLGAAVTPPAAIAPLPAKPATRAPARRLTVKLRRRGRVALVSGRAPAGARVKIVLKRGKRVIARRTVKVRAGSYRARIRIRGRGRVTALVSTGTQRATARR
jgi:predicted acyl esterase